MKIEQPTAWIMAESGFNGADGTRLFYRFWEPARVPASRTPRALIFLHRGHEHSGRIGPLVERFGLVHDWAFAYDARGHGHSPGERGDAPAFATLVDDLNRFVKHVAARHGIAQENMVVIAGDVGAVVAATWLHDYAPRIRGIVLAAAAFSIKLRVPLAKPVLRLAHRLKPDLFVTTAMRADMLTRSREKAAACGADPLIVRSISARILLELADTAQRIVADAVAIDVPLLMLTADSDQVVEEEPQRQFFDRLGSTIKRHVRLRGCTHAVFYEPDPTAAVLASLDFISACHAAAPMTPAHYAGADRNGPSARAQTSMQRGERGGGATRAWVGLQKRMLGVLGPLSDGMRIGLTNGFDSGESLDYVYLNQAGGQLGIGALIDRHYLGAVVRRGIRARKTQLEHMLAARIADHPAEARLRILDIAAGSARYVLETVKRFQDRRIEVTLRDYVQHNVDSARRLAQALQIGAAVHVQLADAFSDESYTGQDGRYDIAVVSGLYELVSDNDKVLASLRGVVRSLRSGGYLIYTSQGWHPQLDMIARTSTQHRGQPRMRARPQAEIDALVALAGAEKIDTAIGPEGIFTVSLARKRTMSGAFA